MIIETNVATFRLNLGEMLGQVQFRRDSIVVNKNGRAVAALIDAKLFERIRRMRERFNALATRLADAYATVPEGQGMAEIQRTMTAERAKPRNAVRRKKR